MKIKDHPRAMLTVLVIVFFVALALSLYLPSYYGVVQTQTTPSGGTVEVVYWHVAFSHSSKISGSSANFSGLLYNPAHCVHHA